MGARAESEDTGKWERWVAYALLWNPSVVVAMDKDGVLELAPVFLSESRIGIFFMFRESKTFRQQVPKLFSSHCVVV